MFMPLLILIVAAAVCWLLGIAAKGLLLRWQVIDLPNQRSAMSDKIAVRDVFKKGEVLVGFHEKRSSFVADIGSCEVLPKRISDLLIPLRRLVESLSIRKRLPQIEVACGDCDGRRG